MMLYYIIILAMTLASSFAGFFLKKSTNGGTVLSIIASKYLYIGGFLYVIAASFSIWLLQRMPYFVVVSLGSVTYIWTMFIARIFLQEKVGMGKIIGVLLIFLGVVFIAI